MKDIEEEDINTTWTNVAVFIFPRPIRLFDSWAMSMGTVVTSIVDRRWVAASRYNIERSHVS